MEKVKFDYDSERKTFYFFQGDESHRIVNVCLDEDITILVDFDEDRAVGVLITNFDVLYPKHVTAIGTPHQELVSEFFSITLRDINHSRHQAKEETAFRKFISGEQISHCMA